MLRTKIDTLTKFTDKNKMFHLSILFHLSNEASKSATFCSDYIMAIDTKLIKAVETYGVHMLMNMHSGFVNISTAHHLYHVVDSERFHYLSYSYLYIFLFVKK